MVPLRTLVRFKIFHLAAAAAAAGPAATALSGGGLPGTEAVLAAATVGACGGGAAALNWLARRYVGELSLLEGEPGGRTLVVSTLDGWGRRVDEAVAVDGLVPPLAGLPPDAAAAAATARPLLAVDVRGGGGGSGRASRQLLVSLTHNAFVDRDAVMRLLTGG